MAKFTIIYRDSKTVTRVLEFMGHTFTYEWNRTDMTLPDFRAQALAVMDSLTGTHIPAILDNLSYYNDDIPTMVGTLADYEDAQAAGVEVVDGGTDAGKRHDIPP